MSSRRQPTRWDRVARARTLIEAGFYDDPQVREEHIARASEAILQDLDSCPVGEGDMYRDLAAETLALSLGDVVDRLGLGAGNVDAILQQLFANQRLRHVILKMLKQHMSPQARTEVTLHMLR